MEVFLLPVRLEIKRDFTPAQDKLVSEVSQGEEMTQPSVVTTQEAIQRLAISADLNSSERQVIAHAAEEPENEGNPIAFVHPSRIRGPLDRSGSSN
jgi:hypothetical protein